MKGGWKEAIGNKQNRSQVIQFVVLDIFHHQSEYYLYITSEFPFEQ
jgi:hypothetical protein